MSPLDERSYLRVLGAVHAVREITDPDQFGPVVLAEIAALIDCVVLSFNEVDPARGHVDFVLEPADFVIPPGSERALDEHAHAHPLISYAARTGDGSARKISDFLAPEHWHDTPIYRELYAPMGIEFQMSIGLPAPRPIVVGIALNRSDVDFSERDRTVLELLRPHLAQGWRQAREHRRIDALVHAASEVLQSARLGVIVLADPPHELTTGSLARLYRFFGRPGRDDPLPPRVARWADRQRAAALGAEELIRPMSAERDGARLVLRYLPASPDHAEAILLSEDAARPPSASLTPLGLTSREAQVLAAVATGATNATIGAQLHVAASTVKKHLDNIYLKLGASNRTEAVAILLEMQAHHSGEEPG